MFKIAYIMVVLLILTSCDKTPHTLSSKPDDEEGNKIGITLNNSEVSDIPLNDVNVYWFDSSDILFYHDYYRSMKELASAQRELPVGEYTIVAVVNVGDNFIVPDDMQQLAGFNNWLKSNEDAYENMLSGLLRFNIYDEEQLITVDLHKGALKEAVLELLFSVPSPRLPDFTPSRTGEQVALRAVIYVHDKATNRYITAKKAMLKSTANEGVYSMSLSILAGDYALNAWVDYTTATNVDNYYITSDPQHVTIRDKESYVGNTDVRDCFVQNHSLIVKEDENQSQFIQLMRPVAKYRLVATDIEKYEKLRVEKNLPTLDELKVFVAYQGYFITSYDIKNKMPDGSELGYRYISLMSDKNDKEATVCKDYVFVNGTESLVILNITITNTKGDIISRASGIRVDYKAGHLTTVRGEFLTAGIGGGGSVDVETKWDGEYNVSF